MSIWSWAEKKAKVESIEYEHCARWKMPRTAVATQAAAITDGRTQANCSSGGQVEKSAD